MTYTPNFLCATDAYKGGHYRMYPKDTEGTRLYIAPRGAMGKEAREEFVTTGFKYYVDTYLKPNQPGPFTKRDLEKAMMIWNQIGIPHGKDGKNREYPFPVEQFRKLIDKPLPVTIYGFAEGTVSESYNTPIGVIECTDPEFFWLPGFMETAFQRAIWYPSTIATYSRNLKKVVREFYDKNVKPEDRWSLEYRVHDFGARGATCGEQAGIGGAAHLINFSGTDTIEACEYLIDNYGILPPDICTPPAAEHATITAHGPDINAERTALIRMIKEFAGRLFSFVSDSYNFRDLIRLVWCDPEIIKAIRESGAIPVVRPDSGDPIRETIYALGELAKAWGYTENGRGYNVLNGIAMIYGDGMDMESTRSLYQAMHEEKWAANNMVVGMGGGLLQKNLDRDRMKWSMKLFQVKRNGIWMNVQKRPATQKDKIAWNPEKGVNLDHMVHYYGKNLLSLPEAVHDFQAIRQRAA